MSFRLASDIFSTLAIILAYLTSLLHPSCPTIHIFSNLCNPYKRNANPSNLSNPTHPPNQCHPSDISTPSIRDVPLDLLIVVVSLILVNVLIFNILQIILTDRTPSILLIIPPLSNPSQSLNPSTV